jgi:hypothetical protein
MKATFVMVVAVVLASSLVAVAADPSSNLPKLIILTREDIKMGKMGEHDAVVHKMIQTANSTNANFHWISGRSITGNISEYIGVTFADTYADLEKDMQALNQLTQTNLQNADVKQQSVEAHQSGRSILAHLRPDLCYRPQQVDIANAHYWEVSVLRFKPGTMSDFEELEKEGIELHKKANIDERWATYQVDYGTPGPTLLIVTPLRSLADLDVDTEAVHKAVFTAPIRRQFESTVKESLVYEDSTVVMIRPEISHPSPTIVAANPDFWTVKEPVADAPPAKTKGKKASVQPAGMKEKEPPK